MADFPGPASDAVRGEPTLSAFPAFVPYSSLDLLRFLKRAEAARQHDLTLTLIPVSAIIFVFVEGLSAESFGASKGLQ
jgi:hypothetical protein